MVRIRLPLALACLGVAAAACSAGSTPAPRASAPTPAASASATDSPSAAASASASSADLPGMPPLLDPHNVYAADRPNDLSPFMRTVKPLVYVPETLANRVDVIDPATYRIVETIPVGALPQHVVPSYDMRTLWVNANVGNELVPIDPRTGKAGAPVPVDDPYNLYFTPDGRYAVVMAERNGRLDFRDPHTMKLHDSTPLPGCSGPNHADFSADGRYFVVSCEFNGKLVKVDTETHRVLAMIPMPGPHKAQPQDVKLAPDGSVFYIADMAADGVWVLDGVHMKVVGFIASGKGTHGLYVSRDAKFLYATNRGEGSISLIDLATRKVAKKWWLPGGGSPDMGNLSADGKVLWLSGRYNSEVYAISTTDGRLLARIKVGRGPHGLTVYPQPGRYSLGHTGIFR